MKDLFLLLGFKRNQPILGAPVFSTSFASFPIQMWIYGEERYAHSLYSLAEFYDAMSLDENLKSSFYLIPGIQDHDIISGKIWLSEVSWYFFNLRDSAEGNSDWPFILIWSEWITLY